MSILFSNISNSGWIYLECVWIVCKHFDLKVLEAGGLEWISMEPVWHLVFVLDNFFASVVATLFGCVNNFYLGAVVSVVCPPMLRLLSAAPCPQGSRYSATLPGRRKRPIDTHRCDSSVLCCLNSITQQMMMIRNEACFFPKQPGSCFHWFVIVSSSNISINTTTKFFGESQKKYLCLGILPGNWSFTIQQKHVYLS